ncbi:MAG: DUF4372 domain-containing protein [Planctomycetaceae bacterium]|jgi:hypothetical protein|nr:DUF4372 domain-containing protein [Planctomycetaceae bacterium]
MHDGQYVFTQIMNLITWRRFQTCVARYQDDYRVRQFRCADYFRVMLLAQFTYRESLRDVVSCLRAVPQKLYHMGIHSPISRSTISDATQHRE